MTENKRFRKVMGFIQDITCEGGDMEGVMDLTEIEDMLNRLNDENIKLRWILRHYNPEDLNMDFDDEKFKEQIELLYRELKRFRDREEKYQRVISGVMAFLQLYLNSELWCDWDD